MRSRKLASMVAVTCAVVATGAGYGRLTAMGEEAPQRQEAAATAPGALHGGAQNQARTEEARRMRWLEESLTEVQKIQVGATRREVEQVFELDGGLQPMNPLTMVYRKCNYIKVGIDFATKKDAKSYIVISPDDKVTHMTRPFLERPHFG